MIDMTDNHSCVPAHRSHFSGNGSCDATREANKRADQWTGMESEIAPYREEESAAARNGMVAQNGTATRSGAVTQAPRGSMTTQMMTQQTGAAGAMAPYGGTMANGGGNTAAKGYDDPEYGPDHEFTVEEEDGMNSLPQEDFETPVSADEAARNSWRALLARNVGRNVLVRFLMGTQNLITVEGELYEVGTDYIVIYQPLWDSHITADLYSVKFVEFREPPGVMTLA